MPEATEATMVIGKLFGRCNVPASADPDLPIRGGGGGGRSTTPRDYWSGAVEKKFFSAPRATVWSKNTGGGPPGPLPWICH